ncbi:MAG: hypothetical protein R3324_06325 [Halobacteriales archaeon]|nr:hypothetical protein [Halobacteriales archaeon]
MSGKYELLVSVLSAGIADGDGLLIVTTNRNSGAIIDDFEERAGSAPNNLYIVDAVSEQQGDRGSLPPERVRNVSSPGDLTGIGIAVSEHFQDLVAGDTDRTRLGFYSLSTLLMYADIEGVFRFLHVLTGRVTSIQGLGLFAIDPTTHDESTINTLKQLFDGMIEVRGAEGSREVRIVGVSDVEATWQPVP